MQPRSTYRDREAGLSLIEILVGVTIMASVALAVTLTMRPSPSPLRAESDALAARLQMASEEAVISGQPVGLVVAEFGSRYAFYRYVDQRWWPLADHPALRARMLPDEVRLRVSEGGFALDRDGEDADQPVPVIWFDPAGLTDPFTLRLETAEGSLELDWRSDGALARRGGV